MMQCVPFHLAELSRFATSEGRGQTRGPGLKGRCGRLQAEEREKILN